MNTGGRKCLGRHRFGKQITLKGIATDARLQLLAADDGFVFDDQDAWWTHRSRRL